MVTEKNHVHIIDDTDKNLGPANVDKSDVINECKRQLYDVMTYSKLSFEEMESFVPECIAALCKTVNYHFYLGNCSQKEKEFIGKIIPHAGHKVWEINDENLDIELAKYEVQTFIIGKNHNNPEIIIRNGFSYVSALNKSNALKKYKQGINGSKEAILNPLKLKLF